MPTGRPGSLEGRIRRLWLRMAEIYGHKWTATYGADAATGAGSTWAKGLAGMDDSEFQAGIENCILSADPWPPTLPEFRAMCLNLPEVDQVVSELLTMRPPQSEFAARVLDGAPDDLFRRYSIVQCMKLLATSARNVRKEIMRETIPEQAMIGYGTKALT